MAPKKNSNVFVQISNKDIYDEIQAMKVANEQQHNLIIQRLDVTNGKVKLTKWMATTGIALILIVITIVLEHISKLGGK